MIELTDHAAQKIKDQLESRGKGFGVRIGVKTTGCSGLAYVFEYVDEVRPEDMSFVSHGIHLFVDPKSLAYLDDLVVDYKKEQFKEGFDFINAKETGRCGCGESFRV